MERHSLLTALASLAAITLIALPVAGLRLGWAFAWRSLMAGELLVTIAGLPSIGQLLSVNQDQQDTAGAISIMIVILTIGIVVDMGFNQVNNRIRRRWGLVDAATGL